MIYPAQVYLHGANKRITVSRGNKGMTNSIIRVQLVENLALLESGIRGLLEAEPDLELVAHTDCDVACQQQCVQQQPDVLILDVTTFGQCNLDCLQRILESRPETRILVLDEAQKGPALHLAMKAGAAGYASKNMSSTMLVQAIHEVATGQLFIEPDLARNMVLEQVLGKQDPFTILSGREYEIMCLLVAGKSVAEISATISLSHNTVANYHTHILQKLDIANDVQLTHLAIRHRIVNV